MNGAVFILFINLIVAGLLGGGFLMIAVYDRARTSARWIAISYALGMFYFLLEAAIPELGGSPLLLVATYGAFMAALAVFNAGLARLYDLRIPWRTMAVIFAASIILRYATVDMERDSLLRMIYFQGPYAVMQAIGVTLIWRSGRRSIYETLLAVVLAATSVHYLAKPFIALALGGMGTGPENYLGTTYALFSQSSGTVLAMATALLLIVILVRDVLADATAQSRTDTLSGLFNRRGFEERRDAVLRQRASNGLPVSLIMCDLDHFKIINDTHGHAAGDLVIVAFARLLRQGAAAHHVVSRIGGEEFAILLPGSNIAAARLYAENIRSAFAMLGIAGLPARGFTASFGVAELAEGEVAQEFEARADAALYSAKRGGRDRVHLDCASSVAPDGERQISA